MSAPFVAHDWCGWNDRYGRFTHVVEGGTTLLCRPYMDQVQWDRALDPAGPDAPLMGIAGEVVARLEARLA